MEEANVDPGAGEIITAGPDLGAGVGVGVGLAPRAGVGVVLGVGVGVAADAIYEISLEKGLS
jgi:hypothetical protein